MEKVLFISHVGNKFKCGVYQYGLRVFSILNKDTRISYIYFECDSYNYYLTKINSESYKAIIYNYCDLTMPWINNENISKYHKNIVINHESYCNFADIIISVDASCQESGNIRRIPRPLIETSFPEEFDQISHNAEMRDFISFGQETKDTIPIIGSFGFGSLNKGFDRIVQLVNNQFDQAVIKFIIPYSDFCDADGHIAREVSQYCHIHNTKPGIKLMITHEFVNNDDLLKFLRSNTINIFMYHSNIGRGNSSVIDYALSVNRPLGLSNSYMFKHVYSSDLDLTKVSIKDCIKSSLKHVQDLTHTWNNENLRNAVYKIILECTSVNQLSPLTSRSQAEQDLFVILMTQSKKGGCYLEIGANHPQQHNNTYLLEKDFQWNGIIVGYDNKFKSLYEQHRPKSRYIVVDAVNLDYVKELQEMSKNMDYLQINLNVETLSALNTLIKLNLTIFDQYKFATITFKHDIYSGNHFDTRENSRIIFNSRGYILLFSNVKVFWLGNWVDFEDWYVHPDLINAELIRRVKEDSENVDGLSHETCIKIIKKY